VTRARSSAAATLGLSLSATFLELGLVVTLSSRPIHYPNPDVSCKILNLGNPQVRPILLKKKEKKKKRKKLPFFSLREVGYIYFNTLPSQYT
jgi:hypothetical protein